MKQKSIFHIIIATGFGSGFSPFAPGTMGAIVATAMWIGLSFLVSYYQLLLITVLLIALFTALGIWSANKLEATWGKDPSRVVVDEMVGVWIPLLAADIAQPYSVVLAFIFFRLFDIYKPLGIRKMESFKGGVGVMMDDVLAGIYSLVLLLGLRWVIG
ncbi:MAG: phosphatidylglycerophosphatase A [Dysgonomonas sp.]